MRQVPTKSAQNMCPGSHAGTMPAKIVAAVKCSVPNTAKGTAKKTGPRTTILSRPFFCEKLVPDGDEADCQNQGADEVG